MTKTSLDILEEKLQKEKNKEIMDIDNYDDLCDLWPTSLKKEVKR